MKAAPEAFPEARRAAPVMERKVHVPLRKSSCSLSRSRMRHSNQPSSSRVSRSTRREAPRVSDTRPLGRKGGVTEERAEGRGRESSHTQADRRCQQMQGEGAQSRRTGRHPVSQRPQSKSKTPHALVDKTFVTDHTNGMNMTDGNGGKGRCTKQLSSEESTGP